MLIGPGQPEITEESGLLVSSVAGGHQRLDSPGLPLEGQNGQTCFPLYEGIYYVEITGENGCVSVSEPYLFLINGILKMGPKVVSVSPNPARENTLVSFAAAPEKRRIQVFSAEGKLISEYPVKIGETAIQISLGTFSAGSYFIRFDGHSKGLLVVPD